MKDNKMTYFFLILCTILMASRSYTSAQPFIDVKIAEDQINSIVMDTTKTVEMVITFASFRPSQRVCKVKTHIETLEPERVQVAAISGNQTLLIPVEKANQNVTVSFTINAIYLGFFKLIVNVSECVVNEQTWTFNGSVIFLRNAIFQVFRYGLLVIVSLNQFNMGTQTKLEVIKKCFAKPIAPAIGLFCQFVIMPGISYAVGYLLFQSSPSWRLSMFIFACSPGGNQSNFWTYILDGDINLSVAMTFVSTLVSLEMLPLWLFTVGKTLVTEQIQISYTDIIISLITFLIPTFLGFAVRVYKQCWVTNLKKFIKPLSFFVIILILFFLLFIYNFVFTLFSWSVILAGFIIPLLGFTSSACIAKLFRLETAQVIALTIEVAFQNPNIVFVILQFTLPPPTSDLAGVPCISQVLLTTLPLLIVSISIKVHKCFKSRDLLNQPLLNNKKTNYSLT